MSIIDEPMIVLSCASDRFLYTAVFDPRDRGVAYFRCNKAVPGRGIGTSCASLPDNVRVYFRREGSRLAAEWNRANGDSQMTNRCRGCGRFASDLTDFLSHAPGMCRECKDDRDEVERVPRPVATVRKLALSAKEGTGDSNG